VAYLFKARTAEPEKQPLLGNSSVKCNSGISVGSGVFCAVRAEATYNEDHLPLRHSHERAVNKSREAGVRWPPACGDMSLGAEERPLLEDVTKQHSEYRD
jgi:hypothetical protein